MIRRVPILILALALAGAVPAVGADKPPALDVSRVINDSYSFRKNQEPEMTEDEYALYEKAVALIPVQPEFALKLLLELVAGQKRSPAFELVLGNLYYTNGHVDLAEKQYRKAIAAYPTFGRAWANLGALLYARGSYAEAGDCLVKTIEGGDRDAHNLGLLAYCMEKTGRTTTAEMDYLQALGLDPNNPDYLEGLARLYFAGKQYAQAEVLLVQLVGLKPQDRDDWSLYANVLMAEDRKLEAIAALEAADGMGALDREGRTALGELYVELRFYKEATDTFQRLQKDSADLGAEHLLQFAQGLIASHHLDTAEEVLGSVKPDLTSAHQITLHQTYAELYSARKKWPEAQARYEALLGLDPLNGGALLGLGRIYKAQNELLRADGYFETATRQPAVAQRACLEVADDALRQRRYQRALDYLERAFAIDKSPVVQQYIAKVKPLVSSHEDSSTAP